MSVYTILEHFEEPKLVTVAIPLREQDDQLILQGIATILKSPSFQIFFQKEYLPNQEDIDTESKCRVTLSIGGPTLSVFAEINSLDYQKDRDVIQLTALDLIEHAQKRQYLRAPAEQVTIHYKQQDAPNEGALQKAQGINISCGGLLFVTKTILEEDQKLRFEITLPYPDKITLICFGSILRVKEKRDGTSLIAIKFDDIPEEDCDAIMAYCFAEQRRQLRENVRVSDM
jgi:hypothetical protein